MAHEAMKQAVVYFEHMVRTLKLRDESEPAQLLFKLRQAIEQAEKQEPMAWATMLGSYSHVSWGKDRPDYPIRYEVPLYTTPQQRTWVGLTVGETAIIVKMLEKGNFFVAIAAIEAKLKEKNT